MGRIEPTTRPSRCRLVLSLALRLTSPNVCGRAARRIRQMADSPRDPVGQHRAVNLLIVLVREHPPVGEVRIIGGSGSAEPACEPTSSSGWLGLIGVLEVMLGERGESGERR